MYVYVLCVSRGGGGGGREQCAQLGKNTNMLLCTVLVMAPGFHH